MGRSGKRVVRCRDWLKSRWVGKGSYVNGLVKKGAGGRGKSSSYLLKTRRAERVHGWSRHIKVFMLVGTESTVADRK